MTPKFPGESICYVCARRFIRTKFPLVYKCDECKQLSPKERAAIIEWRSNHDTD